MLNPHIKFEVCIWLPATKIQYKRQRKM